MHLHLNKLIILGFVTSQPCAGPPQFECRHANGTFEKCIEGYQVCDTVVDCPASEGLDEAKCGQCEFSGTFADCWLLDQPSSV